jgi:hypothetical protein
VLTCDHGGVVRLDPVQGWITIAGERMLVEGDLAERRIVACPMPPPATPPCTKTVSVQADKSYAGFISVRSAGLAEHDRRVCVQAATGRTDSKVAPIHYTVSKPGQAFVTVAG